MKTLAINLILVISLVVGSVYPLMAQTPEQLYQKGLMKEEGEGELLDAIDFYNQVTDNSNADESLQAKSLLRIGMCYEKLGKDEATKAYQELVNNFPGEKQEVAIARERLNKLILEKNNSAQKIEQDRSPKVLTNKKVWNEAGTDVYGEISPNGKYLSFIDWDTGDLAIYNVETGNKRRITNKGTWEESDEYVENCKWFSDSKKLAYVWYNKDNYTELRTIDINNPKPEIVLKDKRNEWMEIYDCSPDGNKALACLWKTGDTTQIVLISIIDGSVEILKSTEDLEPNEMTFTPDGRNIVFDLLTKNKDDNGDIYMMNLFSKAETVLVEYPGNDQLLGWVPNTNSILFVSDRAGSPDIWKIEVDKSKPVGKPELIQNIKGPFVPQDLGFTDEGVFYYGKMTSKIDVFEAELDPSTGKVLKKAEKSIKKYVGLNGTPNYSNDGNFIAYVSKRSSGTMKFTTNHIGNVLCIKSLITGEETELRPNIKLFGWPRWSSDDKSVMVVSLDKGYSYYQIDTQTGYTKPLFLTQARNLYGGHHLSKDYKTIYYGIRDSLTKEYKLVERDINKQTEKVLYKSDGKIGISMSPNEKHIAIVSDLEKCLKLIPVGGGEIKELLNSEVLNKFDLATWGVQMAWSHDNKHIYFVIGESEKRQLELCRTSVEKGTFERTGLISFKQFANLSIHPDGRRITFSARGESNSEVWAMENFLEPEKLAQKEEAKEPEGIRIRQISKESYLDDLGTVSSDGKYLSCVDWGDGDLAICNLLNGEKRLLTHEATLVDDPDKFVIRSAISKNGKLVAYSWWRPYHTFDLHIFDTEKNTSKLLFKEEGVEVYPLAWLSDDKLIAIKQNRNEETTQITLFNVSDGTFQNLKSLDKRQWAQLCTSPDEEYIAYNTIGGGNSDINLLTADGKSELSLVAHPANDKVIGWIPSRKDFLFTSDRSGTWDLWTLPVMNGKPVGEAKRLFTEFGDVAPIGITEKGDCFFGFSRRNFNAYITSVDKTTGKPDQKPTEVLAGSVFSNSWSPNGEYMACVKQKKSSFELILQETNNGNERRLAKELVFAMAPHWSSDGNSIYIFGMDQEMRQTKGYKGAIYTVDVETGDIRENLQISEYKYTPSVDDALPISGHVVSDDNKYIYLLFQNDWIVKRNLANGTDTILYRHPGFVRGVLQLSPDGKKLLFAVHDNAKKQSRLITISVNGGDERELCTSQDAKISGSAFWSPDGKFIYFSERLEGTKLWRVKAEGGKPEKVWHIDKRAESFAMHPLGKEISYTVRERITEIRVIEGLEQELDKIYSQNE